MTSEQATEEVKDLKNDIWSMSLLPSTAQFVSLYRFAFKLPEIEIEELEDGLQEKNELGGKVLQELLVALGRGIYPSRGVNASNLEEHINRLLKKFWRLEKSDQEPLPEGKTFSQLDVATKVEFLHFLCCLRVDKPDAEAAMKTMDADALRVQPLGNDDEGNEYWYFFGTRLYKQEPAKEKAKGWEEEWNHQKDQSFNKRTRGRGRPRKCKQRKSDGESDEFEDVGKNGRYMNIDEKSRWSVVCNTIEDWVDFAEKLKGSKSKNEKALFQTVTDNFLPVLNDIYQEKERRLQQKLRELVPRRVITRRETRKSTKVKTQEQNGYDAETAHREHLARDRAQRLEERNRRLTQSAERSKSRSRRQAWVEDDDEEEDDSADEDYFQDVDSIPQSEESNDYRKAFLPLVTSGGTDLKSQVLKVLSEVKLQKDAWPFLYPVEETYAPGYYEIITDPMDLSTMTNKLLDNAYKTIGNVDEDFRRMVDNCKLYNGENSGMSNMVMKLWRVFRKGMSEIGNPQSQPPSAPSRAENPVSRATEFPKESEENDYTMKRASDSVKENRRKKMKKIKHMDAIELLSQQARLSVENSSTSDIDNLQPRQMSLYSDLKIVPIHSHPASLMEKYSDSSNNEADDLDSSNASALSYMEQNTDKDSSTKDNMAYYADKNSAPNDNNMPYYGDKSSAAKDSNMPYFAPNEDIHDISELIEKNSGGKGFNILSDGEGNNQLLSDHESELQSRSGSYNNVSESVGRGPKTSSPLSGLAQDGVGVSGDDNLMPGLPREAMYSMDEQRVSPVNPSVSPNNAVFSRKSPQNAFAVGRNPAMVPGGQRSNDMTTVDASALGISTFGQFNSTSVSSMNQLTQSMESFPTSNPFAKVVQSPSKNKPRYSPTFTAQNQDFQGSFQYQTQRPNSGEHRTTMASSNNVATYVTQQPMQAGNQQTLKSFQNPGQIQVATQQSIRPFQNPGQIQIATQQQKMFQNPGQIQAATQQSIRPFQNAGQIQVATQQPKMFQNPGSMLLQPNSESNKFPTMKVALPPSTGELLVVPSDNSNSGMTFHLFAQPHSNPSQPIQSRMQVFADGSVQHQSNHSSNNTADNQVSTIMKAPSREDKGNKDDQSQKRKSPLQNNQLQTPTTIQQPTTLAYQFSPASKSFSNLSGQPRYPEATYTSVNTIPSYTNVNTSVVRPNALRHHNPNATAFTHASEIQTSCKPNVVKLQSPNTSFTNDSPNLFLQNPTTYQTMTTVPQAFPSYSYRQASVNGAGNATTTVTTTNSAQPRISVQKVFLQPQNSVVQNGNGQFIILPQQQVAKRTAVGEQKAPETPRTMAEPVTTASYYPATNNVFTLQTSPGNPSQMYAQVLPNSLPQYVNHQGTPYFIVTDPNTIQNPQRYPLMNMQTVPFPNR